MMMRITRRLVVVAWLGLLLFPACGGGSGGGGDDHDAANVPTVGVGTVRGTYSLAAYEALANSVDRGTAGWGSPTFDGLGMFAGTSNRNAAGVVAGPLTVSPAAYAIDPSGSTVLDFGVPEYSGWTDTTGDVILLADMTATYAPYVLALVRHTRGFTTGNLAGDYHTVLWLVDLAGLPYCSWGDENLDGAGAAAWRGRANDDGVIKGSLQNDSTYGALWDGTMNYGLGITRPLAGAVGAGGDVILLAGSSNDSDAPILRCLVRKTSGATAAAFAGDYQIVGIRHSGAGYQAVEGRLTSNGAGSLVTSLAINTNGVISTGGASGTYSAASDGSLQVLLDGAELHGGFSADGRYAILGGDDTPGGDPAAYILLRR